ncbi:MAG TPA: hypothetical protein VK178_07200 [Opitutaceae bacterium]|nr:hypothetical protein [Opitutaceae bacterium]
MKSLRRLIAAVRLTLAAWAFLRRWHRLEHGGWSVPPRAEVKWEPGHAAALKTFLESPTGAALIEHLRWTDLRTTAHAVFNDPVKREFRCGYAAGFRATVSYLVTLSTPPAAVAGPVQSDGADDLRERLAP